MKTVNENTSVTVTLQFVDVNGAAVTPNSVEYQVTDECSGTPVVPWTTFAPGGASTDLDLAAEAQQIINQFRDYETRIVSVIALYNASAQQITAEFRYRVKNMRSIYQINRVSGRGGFVLGGSAGSI